MTKQELNRDIKRLANGIKKAGDSLDTTQYFNYIDETAKPEFKRLYNADNTFQYMNRESVLIMLRLNLRHRFIALHTFGIHIEI